MNDTTINTSANPTSEPTRYNPPSRHRSCRKILITVTTNNPIPAYRTAGWARQNRLAPGNEVSNGRKNWLPAETLPELGMEWMVPLTRGRLYGPIHRLAALYLVRQGNVARDAVMINKITGEEITVQSLLEADARQLPLAHVLDKAETHPIVPTDKPAANRDVESPAAAPTPDRDRQTGVSQLALELSGYVETTTAAQKLAQSLRETGKNIFRKPRHEKPGDINRRLARQVERLRKQLVEERLRVRKLEETLATDNDLSTPHPSS